MALALLQNKDKKKFPQNHSDDESDSFNDNTLKISDFSWIKDNDEKKRQQKIFDDGNPETLLKLIDEELFSMVKTMVPKNEGIVDSSTPDSTDIRIKRAGMHIADLHERHESDRLYCPHFVDINHQKYAVLELKLAEKEKYPNSGYYKYFRASCFQFLHNEDSGAMAQLYYWGMTIVIIIAVVAGIISSDIRPSTTYPGQVCTYQDGDLAGEIVCSDCSIDVDEVGSIRCTNSVIEWIELITTMIFTVDYVARIWAVQDEQLEEYSKRHENPWYEYCACCLCVFPCCRPADLDIINYEGYKYGYICDTYNLIDLLAISPYYLQKLLTFYLGDANDIGGINGVIRCLRLLRLAKLKSISTEYTSLIANVLTSTAGVAVSIFIYQLVICIIFATLMFEAEKEQTTDGACNATTGVADTVSMGFTSTPNAMWWAMVTMTTVGYGDLYAQTGTGFFFTGVCMLIGVALNGVILMVVAQYYVDNVEIIRSKETKMTDILLKDGYLNHKFGDLFPFISIDHLIEIFKWHNLLDDKNERKLELATQNMAPMARSHSSSRLLDTSSSNAAVEESAPITAANDIVPGDIEQRSSTAQASRRSRKRKSSTQKKPGSNETTVRKRRSKSQGSTTATIDSNASDPKKSNRRRRKNNPAQQ